MSSSIGVPTHQLVIKVLYFAAWRYFLIVASTRSVPLVERLMSARELAAMISFLCLVLSQLEFCCITKLILMGKGSRMIIR